MDYFGNIENSQNLVIVHCEMTTCGAFKLKNRKLNLIFSCLVHL